MKAYFPPKHLSSEAKMSQNIALLAAFWTDAV